ncbi:MAG: carbonic anhydrase [Acidimicrobiales bacterium]
MSDESVDRDDTAAASPESSADHQSVPVGAVRWDGLLAAHHARAVAERTTVPRHAPRAAIVACSDARVPPSLIFDQPAGSLFVVREAGNTASPAAVASLDYAVAELGVHLVVVLGHTHCGAVAAAAEGRCDGYLAPITNQICGLVADGVDRDELTERNVEATLALLAAAPSPVGDGIRSGRVALQGAVYDLASDTVHSLVPTHPIP